MILKYIALKKKIRKQLKATTSLDNTVGRGVGGWHGLRSLYKKHKQPQLLSCVERLMCYPSRDENSVSQHGEWFRITHTNPYTGWILWGQCEFSLFLCFEINIKAPQWAEATATEGFIRSLWSYPEYNYTHFGIMSPEVRDCMHICLEESSHDPQVSSYENILLEMFLPIHALV